MITKYFVLPNINPIMFSLGPISIHWYGFMYLIGFSFTIWSIKRRKKFNKFNLSKVKMIDILCNCFLGLLIGGRIGYILFYNFKLFLDNPLYLFKIWEGGMSFHGGLIGTIIVIIFISHRKKINFFQITDIIVPTVPFGLGLGRLGNFINGELWGRITTDIPWAVFFPNSYKEDLIALSSNPKLKHLYINYGSLPRHPSQVYEIILEGIVLFTILNIFILKDRPVGSVSALFLIFYGLFRFLIEFFREPDIQLGLFFNFISMGQILSIPMILVGLIILAISYFKHFNVKILN